MATKKRCPMCTRWYERGPQETDYLWNRRETCGHPACQRQHRERQLAARYRQRRRERGGSLRSTPQAPRKRITAPTQAALQAFLCSKGSPPR